MLIQIEHEHEASRVNYSAEPEALRQEPKKCSSNKKQMPVQLQVEQPQSVFFNNEVYRETSSYNFYKDGLEEIWKESGFELSSPVIEAIKLRKKFSQDRIYEAIVHSSNDFVNIHMKDFKPGVKHEISTMFQTIHESVEAGIWDGRYEIGKRNNYFSINRKEGELVAYITEELVKKNISNFRQEIYESMVMSDYMAAQVTHRAQSQAEKTKQAEQFIKKMHEEQNRHEQFISKRKEERHSNEVRSMQERQTQNEQKRSLKKSVVLRRIEKHKEMASKQKEHKQKMQSEYMKLICRTSKPLHKEMEQRYEKVKLQDQNIKYKKMKKLMDERKPISFDDLNEHMDRYDELLQEHEQYRTQKREIKEHEMEIIASNRPYRSKFYSIAAKSSIQKEYQYGQLRTSLIKKQTDFSQHVKRNFLPKADEKKHQQLEDLVKKISRHKNNGYHSRKHIQQGKRNLQKLHLMIGEMRAKNRLKPNIGLESIVEAKPAKRYKSYLQAYKLSRIGSDLGGVSVDYDRRLNQRDDEYVKMEAKMKEAKAMQQDLYLDSAIDSLDFDSHMSGKKMVEHDFIESANAKLAILRKYKMNRGQTLDADL